MVIAMDAQAAFLVAEPMPRMTRTLKVHCRRDGARITFLWTVTRSEFDHHAIYCHVLWSDYDQEFYPGEIVFVEEDQDECRD